MNELLNYTGEIVSILIFACICAFAIKFTSYIEKNLSIEEQEQLERLIGNLVAAAEQMHGSDDGATRLFYVQSRLIEEGYELTNAIRALIESKVYEINQNQSE